VRQRARPGVEALEERLAPTINENVVLGGTLDINPVSSIFPSAAYSRMEVLTTSLPGLNHGTMYRVSLTDAFAWGSGPPNPFEPAASPSFNQDRILAGDGFRYVNDGTGLGQTESIPVKFSNSTGSTTTTDTLVIHINSADSAPQITSQPSPALSQVGPGQSVTLSVTATGPGPLSYQWYSGLTPNTSNPVPGATASTFTTPPQSVGGQYLYWVQVSNAGGVANSDNATVTVEELTTTTASAPATVTYSRAAQQVPMQATVTRSSSGTFGIAAGGVTFTVPGVGSADSTDSTTNPSGTPPNVALATFTIPGRTHAGTYSLDVSYLGNIPLYLAPSSDNSHTLTILKADQTISGFGALPPKTYGDAPFTIGAGVSATSDPDAGGVTFTSLNPSVATISGTTVHIVGAGTAIIVASQAGNEDWNPALNVEQTLIVNPAPLTVTADDATKIYGQENPAFTVSYSGFVNGDTPTSLGGMLSFSTPATAASPVGTYDVTPGGLTSSNYTITFVSGTLRVYQPTPAVTVSGGPFTYDGSPHPADAAATGVGGSPVRGSFTFTYDGSAAAPIQAGSYAVQATFTSADPNYAGATGIGTLVISPGTPALTWSDPAAIVYGTPLSATQQNATANVPGMFTYTEAAGTVLGAGTHTLSVLFTPTDTADYTTATASVTLLVNKATLTITPAAGQSKVYGAAVPALTYSASGFVNGDTMGVLSGSPSLSTLATVASAPGSYVISTGPGSLASADYAFTFGNGTLTVTAAPLSATGVNFLTPAGGPYSGPVATFTNPDPFASAASYTATITWGDGSSSAGVISANGDGTFSVLGTHTYTNPGSYAVGVLLVHNQGFTTPATTASTATAVSLGQPVQRGMVAGPAFWAGQGGQALILNFDGGPSSTTLSAWLAATLPNLFGAAAGACNLTGLSNARVALFYQWLRHQRGRKLEAEVLAVALSIYATTPTLGGGAGGQCGFNVSALGLGPLWVSVGRGGSAFGVANHSRLSVWQLLQAVDGRARLGTAYPGSRALQHQAEKVLDALLMSFDNQDR
jgi:hypothetical protein